MEMPKPTEQDKEFFRSLVPDDPRVEVKPMFGNLGAFVNGNMFAGLFGSSVGVRLDNADREELQGIEGSGPYGPQERPMGGYTSLPAAWRDQPEVASVWLEKAVAFVGAQPPKGPKPAKAKKPR
jgi:TfoX/Sxy family transcriptional regulator of competence genes